MHVNTLKNLACEYLGITLEEFDKRYENNGEKSIEDWNKYGYENFYKETETNIIGLVGFNSNNRVGHLLYPIQFIKGAKVLDFGGGIGISSMAMEKLGNEVYYYDLPSKTQEFAKFVAKRLGYNIKFISEEEIDKMTYDIIITSDVLEHIKNPMETVKRLTGLLNTGGLFLTTGLDFSTGPNVPMHLAENALIKRAYNDYMTEKYILLFFHFTPKEMIYLWVLKKRKV